MLFLYLPPLSPLAPEIVADSTPILGCVFALGRVVSESGDRAYVTRIFQPNSSKWAFLNCVMFPGDMDYSTRGRIPVQLRACRGRQPDISGEMQVSTGCLLLMTRIDYYYCSLLKYEHLYTFCRGRFGQSAARSIGQETLFSVDSDRNSKTDISQ